MKLALILLFFSFLSEAVGHEMTPTYPVFQPSHVTGVWKAELEMFNKRKDVEFYEIGVFTEDWQPVPFVSSYRVMRLKYLSHVKFQVFIGTGDVASAEYVCSMSKLRENSDKKPMVATRICSRFR